MFKENIIRSIQKIITPGNHNWLKNMNAYHIKTTLGFLFFLLIFDRKKAHKLLEDNPKKIHIKFGPSWSIVVRGEG